MSVGGGAAETVDQRIRRGECRRGLFEQASVTPNGFDTSGDCGGVEVLLGRRPWREVTGLLAMQAGIASHVWTIEEIVGLLG